MQAVGGDEDFWYKFTLTKVKTVAAGRSGDAYAEVEFDRSLGELLKVYRFRVFFPLCCRFTGL